MSVDEEAEAGPDGEKASAVYRSRIRCGGGPRGQSLSLGFKRSDTLWQFLFKKSTILLEDFPDICPFYPFSHIITVKLLKF